MTTENILIAQAFLLLSLEFASRILSLPRASTMGGIRFAHPLAAAGILAITHNKKCTQASLVHFYYGLLRKEWDSNPRYTKSVRRISSPVHSITLASFRCKSTTFHFLCKRKSLFFFVPELLEVATKMREHQLILPHSIANSLELLSSFFQAPVKLCHTLVACVAFLRHALGSLEQFVCLCRELLCK